jgi:hypothetical protein
MSPNKPKNFEALELEKKKSNIKTSAVKARTGAVLSKKNTD